MFSQRDNGQGGSIRRIKQEVKCISQMLETFWNERFQAFSSWLCTRKTEEKYTDTFTISSFFPSASTTHHSWVRRDEGNYSFKYEMKYNLPADLTHSANHCQASSTKFYLIALLQGRLFSFLFSWKCLCTKYLNLLVFLSDSWLSGANVWCVVVLKASKYSMHGVLPINTILFNG